MITRNRIRQDCFELVYQLIQYALLLSIDYIDMCDNNEDIALEKERDLTSMIPWSLSQYSSIDVLHHIQSNLIWEHDLIH